MLQDEAGETKKVKFFQEAAIMGQFHHPNVITLHGVVTVGEPVSKAYSFLICDYITNSVNCMFLYQVMIVLELMEEGDLRQHLHSLRPAYVLPYFVYFTYCSS